MTTPNPNHPSNGGPSPETRKAIYTIVAGVVAVLLLLNIVTADEAAELVNEDRIDNILSVVTILVTLMARKNTPA